MKCESFTEVKKTCWSVGCNDARLVLWRTSSSGGCGSIRQIEGWGGHGSSLVVPLMRCSLYRSQRGI